MSILNLSLQVLRFSGGRFFSVIVLLIFRFARYCDTCQIQSEASRARSGQRKRGANLLHLEASLRMNQTRAFARSIALDGSPRSIHEFAPSLYMQARRSFISTINCQNHRCGLGVTSLSLTQQARVRSPVVTVFLVEVFPFFF